jgi:hypothetical protein
MPTIVVIVLSSGRFEVGRLELWRFKLGLLELEVIIWADVSCRVTR